MSSGNGDDKKDGNGKNSWGSFPELLLDPTDGRMDQPPILPGWNGRPFRGPVPHLKEDDPDYRQPKEAAKVHIDVLDLSIKLHQGKYQKISQMVANGFAVISFEERKYDEVKKNWRVLVRWFEVFAYMPPAVAGGQMHGHPR